MPKGKILNTLRQHQRFYIWLKKLYGRTIGLYSFKEMYLETHGVQVNGRRIRLVDTRESDKILAEKIRSGKPFMLARYGSTEFRNLVYDGDFELLCFYSGFFPNDPSLLKKFRQVYFHDSKMIDLLIAWNYKNHFLKKLKLIKQLDDVEYLIQDLTEQKKSAWRKELKNKRVLVIHPFKKSIELQYKRMDKLGIFPKFKSLQVIKAVQTIAGNVDPRFKTWFDALEFMKKEINKKKFDIAIIGCGAYGLPLAAHVKSLGKQAIHLGGGVQILFGIMGKRWENSPNITTNEYWIHPLAEDAPKNYKKVEDGCYW